MSLQLLGGAQCASGALQFYYEVISRSANEGGSSTIKWQVDFETQYNASLVVSFDGTITIDGVHVYTLKTGEFGGAKANLISGTTTINHNFTPVKPLSVNFDVAWTRNTSGGLAPEGVKQQTISKNLPHLNIAARALCTDANVGTAPTITISVPTLQNIPQSNLTYTLTYTFGSHGGTILEKTTQTTYGGFTFPLSFYAEFPNAKYGVGVITCETYNGASLLGYSYTEFRALANEASSTPTIFPTIKDVNSATIALTGDSNTLVRYASNAGIDIGAEARNSATIKSQICANGGKAITTATGTINGVEQAKFTCSATDSRGYTTTISLTKPFIEYIKLTCTLGEGLPDTSGNMSVKCSGSYWAGNFGVAANTITVQYRYKANGGTFSEWRAMSVSTSGNSYTASADLAGLDYRTKYIFQARATDKLMTATTDETAKISLPVFHWSEEDFVFEVPVIFKQGATIGDAVEVESGTWTPALTTTAALKQYTSQRGWYTRVGKVVTIGFNIGVSCNSGYNSTPIAIAGLPYIPLQNAFGGGVMFGTYVNAGFCFEAWCATTGGQITPRLQPCNNTSAGNLQIASTAYYPSGAGTLTLGGTITYLIS
jgi:hypothetical protein